jgi:hypothetical protein
MLDATVRARASRSQSLIPGLFVLLWSTGFAIAKLGVIDAEPFTFAMVWLSIGAVALVNRR